jgi:DNA modification methylase
MLQHLIQRTNQCYITHKKLIGTPYKQKSGKQKTEKENSTVRSKIDQVITENNGTRKPRTIIKFNTDKDKLHPTQKPVALLRIS